MGLHQQIITLGVLVGLVVLRMASTPPWPEELDSLFFVAGVDHYAVAEQRPHFPGYPVYIWVGGVFQAWVGDTTRALHLLSAMATTLVTLPLMALATSAGRRWGWTPTRCQRAGWGVALAWNVCPLTWVDGTEIFSDPLALLGWATVMWGVGWSLEGGRHRGGVIFFLAGLVLGVRLSYWPLLWPLGLLVYRDVRSGQGRWLLVHLVMGMLGVGCWLGWQWHQEGIQLWEAGRRHLSGHVEQWGGSWFTDDEAWSRPFRLLSTTWVYGLGGWGEGAPWQRLPATGVWMVFGLRGVQTWWRQKNRSVEGVLPWVGLSYGVWLVALHDVELARYTFPLVLVWVWLAGIGLATGDRPTPMMGALVVSVGIVTLPLALSHREALAPERQVARWIKDHPSSRPTTLFTDLRFSGLRIWLPEVRVLSGFSPDVEAQARAMGERGQVVYTTAPPGEMAPPWQVVATFCRDPYLRSRGPSILYLLHFDPTASSREVPPCEGVKLAM